MERCNKTATVYANGFSACNEHKDFQDHRSSAVTDSTTDWQRFTSDMKVTHCDQPLAYDLLWNPEGLRNYREEMKDRNDSESVLLRYIIHGEGNN